MPSRVKAIVRDQAKTTVRRRIGMGLICDSGARSISASSPPRITISTRWSKRGPFVRIFTTDSRAFPSFCRRCANAVRTFPCAETGPIETARSGFDARPAHGVAGRVRLEQGRGRPASGHQSHGGLEVHEKVADKVVIGSVDQPNARTTGHTRTVSILHHLSEDTSPVDIPRTRSLRRDTR